MQKLCGGRCLHPPAGSHHPCDEIQQIADILQAADIRQLELDVELLLDGGQQVDLLQTVPVLNIVSAGAAVDIKGVIVKIIEENILYRAQNFLFAHSNSSFIYMVDAYTIP